jgi:deoxycytidine triphosphate deaminase
MSVLDLTERLTKDPDQFRKLNKSSDSLVLVSSHLDPDGSSIDLSVGSSWFDCKDGKSYLIPEDGLELHANGFAVIETNETVALPHNVFGLVVGKGSYIFKGVMISPSKIDPTFHDHLRIGIFNSGRLSVRLEKGEPFCSCCFFMMESDSIRAAPRDSFGPRPVSHPVPRSVRFERLMATPMVSGLVGALTAIGTIALAVITYWAFKHQH